MHADTIWQKGLVFIVVVVIFFSPPPAFGLVMLSSISMTSGAVFETEYSLFSMFAGYFGRRVLVASVTGVFIKICFRMTSRALGLMVPIENKVLVMVKGGRLPTFNAVAGVAIRAGIFVERIVRFNVAL